MLSEDDGLEKELQAIDAKLPMLAKEVRTLKANVLVGKGTVGLGCYHSSVANIVRTTQVREWLSDAEKRLAHKGRDLGAIEEQQKNALLLQKIQREDALYTEQEARRKKKLLDKRLTEEAKEAELEAMRVWKQELQATEQRQRELLHAEQHAQHLKKQHQLEVERYNREIIQMQCMDAEELQRQYRLQVSNNIAETRRMAREKKRRLRDEHHKSARELREGERAFENQRDSSRAAFVQEKKKEAKTMREISQYRKQEAAMLLEELVDKKKEAAKELPNAEQIKQKMDSQVEAVRKQLRVRRAREKLIRSVTSMF